MLVVDVICHGADRAPISALYVQREVSNQLRLGRCSADISQVSHALLLTPQRCWLLQLWPFSLSSPFASPPTRSPPELPRCVSPEFSICRFPLSISRSPSTMVSSVTPCALTVMGRTGHISPSLVELLSKIRVFAHPSLLDIQSALPGERNSFALALVLHKASCAVNPTLVSHIRPLS